MNSSPSILYTQEIIDLEERLQSAVRAGLTEGSGKAVIFFRADDIGVPSRMFDEMIALFQKYQIPLCLAVVPAWLTQKRLQSLQYSTGNSSLFCWHQHGWIHKNHEPSGKKQEFGDHRTVKDLHNDLLRGKNRLTNLLRSEFFPVFTPPWNRCGQTTLNLLENLGFQAISRSSAATPIVSSPFYDLQVNVDLHTRKEENSQDSLARLQAELRDSIRSGTSGVMLHHQRMNRQALHFLEELLRILSSFHCIQMLHFRDLLAQTSS